MKCRIADSSYVFGYDVHACFPFLFLFPSLLGQRLLVPLFYRSLFSVYSRWPYLVAVSVGMF